MNTNLDKVFPVNPAPDKSPALGGATWIGAAKPRAAWSAFESTGSWGLPCGPETGVFVVDIDQYKGTEIPERFRRLMISGATRAVETQRGGVHLYFRWVEGITNAGSVKNIVDIRGVGGYVLTDDSKGYSVVNSAAPIADAPEWLVEELQAATAHQRSTDAPAPSVGDLGLLVDSMPGDLRGLYASENVQGKRSEAIFRLACDLSRAGWDIEDAFTIVRHSANVLAKGWDDNNTWRDVQKAYGDANSQPRVDLWDARPVLQSIRDNARRLGANRWGLLGHAILRALDTVPSDVNFRSFMGPRSINQGAIFLGGPGGGKSQAASVIKDILDFDGRKISVLQIGSGEAIPSHYGKNVVDETTGDRVFAWRAKHGNFSYDEIGSFAALCARNGATVGDYIKQALTGTPIGRLLVDVDKSFEVPGNEYRATLFVNAQPKRCESLFTPDAFHGGLPQRFVWFDVKVNTDDLRNPDRTPVRKVLVESANWAGVQDIQALPEIDDYIREFGIAQSENLDEFDVELRAHDNMHRVKMAIGLMVLDSRNELNAEDWALSAQVMEHSDAQRQIAIEAVRIVHKMGNDNKGKADAERAIAAQGYISSGVEEARDRCAALIRERGPMLPSEFQQSLSRDQRVHRDAALDCDLFVKEGKRYALAS